MSSDRAPHRTEVPEAERLRHFCQTILGILDGASAALPCSSALSRELTRAIGTGIADVEAELRRETQALGSVVDSLRGLPGRYLAMPLSAALLVEELEASRHRAEGVADALASLRPSGSPPPVSPARVLPHSVPVVPALPEYQHPAYGHREDRPDEAELPSLPSPTRRAARVFREGERHHRRQEYERAEVLYSDALEIDSCFGPAYSRRGQVRLARGAFEAAIADFDAAIALDATAVEAWWWRGDAQIVAGRLDAAIADYTRALELRPDLARVRNNLTVALQRKEAAANSTTLPLAPVAPVQLQPPALSKPGKKESGKVAVLCPHCREAGEVPWDRLGRIFACKACQHRFGVGADGIAVELAEEKGKWVEASKQRDQRRRRRNRRIAAIAIVLAAGLFPALGIAGWRAVRPEAAPVEAELPRDLDSRVDLFAKAWLSNDVRLMKRLTSPTHEKLLYAWYNRHRPPTGHRVPADGTPPDGAQIAMTQRPGKPGQMVVRLRIANPKAAPEPTPVEMTLIWEERGESWFFVPPAK